ncbi:MAG: hypothetical protein LBC88_02970, partial [Spirochaetaceae bacterium]|nr:hypothetical protein [Spirochaetaceae bacterium]
MKRMRTSSSHLIKAMCKGVCGAAALAAIVFFAGCANPAGPGPGTGTGSGTDPGSGGGSVTAVTLNKTSAEVETGGTVEFAAAVSGTGDYSALVDWTLDGALDPDTALAVSSTTRRVTLTVGAGETPGELTLTAASRADSAKRARATVTVVRALAGIAWYVAADGDDDAANGGRSADAPFQTLARALEDIKETYLFDSEWPGKGTADAMRACIHIKGEITENMGSSSFLIESSADNAGEYPPIELRGLDQNSPGTLRAPSGKGVLKVAYNTVYLGPDLTLTGYSMETDAIGSGLNIGGGATVYLDGAKITLIKTSAEGAGVYVQGVSEAPAAFIMRSGAVMDNVSTRTTAGYGGGGV